MATPDLALVTAMHVVRERLGIPPPVIEEAESDQFPSDVEPLEELRPPTSFREVFKRSCLSFQFEFQ